MIKEIVVKLHINPDGSIMVNLDTYPWPHHNSQRFRYNNEIISLPLNIRNLYKKVYSQSRNHMVNKINKVRKNKLPKNYLFNLVN